MIRWFLILTLIGAILAAPPVRSGDEQVEHYPGGELRSRCPLDREGRRHGPYLEYYENGEFRVKARYKAGALAGKYDSFHPDGERWISATYKAGALEGKYTERRADGETVLEGKYRKGLRQGIFKLKVGGKARREFTWVDDELLRVDGVLLYPKDRDTIWSTLERIDDPQIDWSGEDAALITDTAGETTRDTDEYIADRRGAFRRLLGYRFLCDVPWEDMELSPLYNYHTKIGAKLLEEIGQLTHWPKNSGWDKKLFRDAYTGTSSSNLSFSAGMRRSVDNYMDDSDAINIAHVGHRIWCLEPRLKVTGFGRSGRLSGMWVQDESRPAIAYDAIFYPPRGYLPVDYFEARHAWSIALNPANHGFPQMKKLEPRIFEIDEDFLPTGEPLELDHKSVDGHTVIFRPAAIDVSAGKRYWIEVHGVRSGKVGSVLTYLVEFIAPPDEGAEEDG